MRAIWLKEFYLIKNDIKKIGLICVILTAMLVYFVYNNQGSNISLIMSCFFPGYILVIQLLHNSEKCEKVNKTYEKILIEKSIEKIILAKVILFSSIGFVFNIAVGFFNYISLQTNDTDLRITLSRIILLILMSEVLIVVSALLFSLIILRFDYLIVINVVTAIITIIDISLMGILVNTTKFMINILIVFSISLILGTGLFVAIKQIKQENFI